MAIYTVKVLGQCSGGEHITLQILKDGVNLRKTMVTKTEIFQNETTWEEAMIFFLRQAIRKANATTILQAKAAVESAEWVV